MSLQSAAVLLEWVRREVGGKVRVFADPSRPGIYFVDMVASGLDRATRRKLEDAIDRNGESMLVLLFDEREEQPEKVSEYPAGASCVNWSSQVRR
jgi:hypothetical protein